MKPSMSLARAEAYRDQLHDLPDADPDQAEIDRRAHELAEDAFEAVTAEVCDWLAEPETIAIADDVQTLARCAISLLCRYNDNAEWDRMQAVGRLRKAYIESKWESYLDNAREQFEDNNAD